MTLRLKKRICQEFVGSWFEIPDPTGVAETYWSEAVQQFTGAQWYEKLREMSELGMKTLLLGSPILKEKSFYRSEIVSDSWETCCTDLLKTLFESADKLGMEIYLAAEIRDFDLPLAQELNRRYGAHPSFVGWQLVAERGDDINLDAEFVSNVNHSVENLQRVVRKPVLLSVSARAAADQDGFAECLPGLRIDFMVYRDGVGMRANEPADLPEVYGRLAEIHREVKIPLWACVELFAFEGLTGKSALIPAAFSRVKTQIETISMYAEALFCCQYLGMMNPGSSQSFAGHPSSATLHYDYAEWRQSRNG